MSDGISELARRLGEALKARAETVATAESCTGGGIAEAITRIPGSSAWFGQGWVIYSNKAKVRALGVSVEALREQGAVSEPVVVAMAEAARSHAGASWSVAVSGIAGPDGGSDLKSVGTVWLAWAGPDGVVAECRHFSGDREAVRRQAVECALIGLLEKIPVANPE